MKKIITVCAALLFATSVFAQAPEKMSYQAVIRNNSNALVTSSTVGMRISILRTTASGTAAYVETQTPTTNSNGLVSIEIGGGTAVSGTFAAIDWADGPYFIKTETDPAGGTSYNITGTSQLLSVPYALHAKSAESIVGGFNETDPVFDSSVASGITTADTAFWNVNPWTVDGDTTYTFKTVGIGVTGGNSLLNLHSESGSHIFMNSGANNTFSRFSNRGFSITDSTENSALSFNFYPIGGPSTLTINNEPTYSFFIPTEYGSGQHINFRIAGMNRLWISGNGVTTISSVMKLTPRNGAPSNPEKGMVYMDDTTNKLRVYDGTQWQNCW
jgi:hypothetical protein